MSKLISIGNRLKVFKSGKGYVNYCTKQLFPNAYFKSKRVLEVGAGNGIYSIWCAIQGASKIVSLEPTSEGSTNEDVKIFKVLIKELDLEDTIQIIEEPFQIYYNSNFLPFDYIILHYSINHLNEEMCIQLEKNTIARNYYISLFKQMYNLLNKNGKIIIVDCSNTNFWSAFGLKNPFAKSIEWFKHQPPSLWELLLKEAGFKNPTITWTYHPRLPHGIFNNKCFAYFYTNLFKLEMARTTE